MYYSRILNSGVLKIVIIAITTILLINKIAVIKSATSKAYSKYFKNL